MRTWTFLLVASLALAGCSDGSSSDDDDFEEIDATDSTGGIRGLVVDQSISALEGATVQITSLNLSTTTKADGTFKFEGLDPGAYFVEASHPLYDTVQQGVDVVAGVKDPKILKIQLTRIVEADPYLIVEKYQGFIVCSLGASVFASEECGEGVGVPCMVPAVGCQRVGGQDNNQVQYDFQLDGTFIETVIIEQTWNSNSGDAGNLFTLWATNWTCDPSCGGEDEINETWGPSPLYIRDDGERVRAAMDAGAETRFSTFSWAEWGASTSDPTQANLVLNQQFELFVSQFYHLPAPEGWSFVAGSPDPFG